MARQLEQRNEFRHRAMRGGRLHRLLSAEHGRSKRDHVPRCPHPAEDHVRLPSDSEKRHHRLCVLELRFGDDEVTDESESVRADDGAHGLKLLSSLLHFCAYAAASVSRFVFATPSVPSRVAALLLHAGWGGGASGPGCSLTRWSNGSGPAS